MMKKKSKILFCLLPVFFGCSDRIYYKRETFLNGEIQERIVIQYSQNAGDSVKKDIYAEIDGNILSVGESGKTMGDFYKMWKTMTPQILQFLMFPEI